MYKIIGADQKEYGPVTREQVLHWIQDNRANAHTQARPVDSDEWRPLSSFPEFAEILGMPGGAGPLPPAVSGTPIPAIEEVLTQDYNLDLGGCLASAWNLFKTRFGIIFGGVLIYSAIVLAIALFSMIPVFGSLVSLANIVISGPLEGGLCYLVLRVIRDQPASVGDVFAGFRLSFVQLFLGKLVSGLLAALCLLPVLILAMVNIIPRAIQHETITPANILNLVVVGLVCLIPAMLLQVNWIFSIPLIIDRQMSFWPAMQASWKMVMRHWWQVFGLVMLIGLINAAGIMLCCVGVLFTAPIGIGALMYAYETIFTRSSPQAR